MRKPPIIATMLLLMGILLVPACDEDKGTDPLALAALYNSKYYLEFDADYDNDGTVDEHVKMRVEHHFDYIGTGLSRYRAEFRGRNGNLSIDLPKETNGPIIYSDTDGWPNFNMLYENDSNDEDYSAYSGNSFSLTIIEWDTTRKSIRANFNGQLVSHWGIPELEKSITITSGELSALVIDYY